MTDRTSRRDALAAGEKHYFTGQPCVNGHISRRTTADWVCVQCRRDAANAFRSRNPVEYKESRKRLRQNGKAAKAQRAWYIAHPGAKAAADKRYREKHADSLRVKKALNRPTAAQQSEYTRRYRAKINPGRVNAWTRNRQARLLQRTPAWADKKAIEAFYEQSAAKRRDTGVRHHVDHIFPLKGKLVSGLHVASNLCVLTESDNCKKSRKFNVNEQSDVFCKLAGFTSLN